MKCVTPTGRPRLGTWLALGGLLLFVLATWPAVRWEEGRSGWGLIDFLRRFWTPPEAGYLPKLAGLVWESILISFAATVWAVVLTAFPAFLAARNISPHPALSGLLRLAAACLRAVPDLLLALLLSSALGLGTVPGVAALVITSCGFLIKNYADALEVVDRKPMEGIAAAGAGWLGTRTIGALPQAAPDLVGLTLYQLDSNLRASAILGAVGAGGIGYDLTRSVTLFQFGRLGPIILSIYIVVTAIDRLSDWTRRRMA